MWSRMNTERHKKRMLLTYNCVCRQTVFFGPALSFCLNVYAFRITLSWNSLDLVSQPFASQFLQISVGYRNRWVKSKSYILIASERFVVHHNKVFKEIIMIKIITLLKHKLTKAAEGDKAFACFLEGLKMTWKSVEHRQATIRWTNQIRHF